MAADIPTGRLPVARMISVILVVLLAGGLFGYDQGVISGALIGIKKEFSLGALVLEVVTSWVTLGALFGSLAGAMSQTIGAASRLCSPPRRSSLRARSSRPSRRASLF
jgi:hypothetical protein